MQRLSVVIQRGNAVCVSGTCTVIGRLGHGQLILCCSIFLYLSLYIVYGTPYCNDAKEGVGGITPPKLNRGGWNSASTKYFEGNVVCKNLGAIGSGAAEGRRKTSLGDPKKTWLFCPHNHARSHPLFTKFSLEHVDRCAAKSFRSRILKFFR